MADGLGVAVQAVTRLVEIGSNDEGSGRHKKITEILKELQKSNFPAIKY